MEECHAGCFVLMGKCDIDVTQWHSCWAVILFQSLGVVGTSFFPPFLLFVAAHLLQHNDIIFPLLLHVATFPVIIADTIMIWRNHDPKKRVSRVRLTSIRLFNLLQNGAHVSFVNHPNSMILLGSSSSSFTTLKCTWIVRVISTTRELAPFNHVLFCDSLWLEQASLRFYIKSVKQNLWKIVSFNSIVPVILLDKKLVLIVQIFLWSCRYQFGRHDEPENSY